MNNNNMELPKMNDEKVETLDMNENANNQTPKEKTEITLDNLIDKPEVLMENAIGETKEKVGSVVNESKDMLKKESKTFKVFIKDAKEYLTTRNSKELSDLVFRLVLIVIVIIAMYVPFQLFKLLGENVLISVGISFSQRSLDLYNSLFNIIYSILGIILFYIICRERFYKLIKFQEESKQKQN